MAMFVRAVNQFSLLFKEKKLLVCVEKMEEGLQWKKESQSPKKMQILFDFEKYDVISCDKAKFLALSMANQ